MNADPMTATQSPLAAFLSGIRVLDLSQYIPGPMATLFLADMGADVLKIEPPGGDEMQHLGPRDEAGAPLFYGALNAGKRVRRLNLKAGTDRDAFLDLAREADVLVEGFRPGVVDRLGIGWPVLKEINPRLVMCSLSGYGATSALRDIAGHDGNYLAELGVMDRNGETRPNFFDPPISDVGGTLFAAIAILGALHGRTRTGKGCLIDLGVADTIMPMQLMQIAQYGKLGTVPSRQTGYLNGGFASYQVYATSGGRHVMLGALEPRFWANFCAAAGRGDLVERHGEDAPQDALRADVAAVFAALTLEEAIARFDAADCCFSVVRDLGEALTGAHVASRDLVRKSAAGDLQALFPAWIDQRPPRSRPPLSHQDD
jgi:crotonobetainyl-CoA:carnitine CoA-transferase CaiB-like acyl-CoA transferase